MSFEGSGVRDDTVDIVLNAHDDKSWVPLVGLSASAEAMTAMNTSRHFGITPAFALAAGPQWHPKCLVLNGFRLF
jgi:hypothetical protein